MSLFIIALLSLSFCAVLHAIANAITMGIVEILLLAGLKHQMTSNQILFANRFMDFMTPLLVASVASFIFFYESMFLYGLYAFSVTLPVISYRAIKSNAHYYFASKTLSGSYEEILLNSLRWKYVQNIQLLIPITGILFLLSFTAMYFAVGQEKEFRELNLTDGCNPATLSAFTCDGFTRRMY